MTMSAKNKWLLPDGIRGWMPREASALECLRGTALRWLGGCGYELVRPPLVEFLDSLLTGAGEDLDLQTFKVVDHYSGRLMGVRPDITPQVARMDARDCGHDAPARFCYAGPVLRARGEGLTTNRESLQCGAELFGCSGPPGDCEIIEVMLGLMERLGIGRVHLDFGHVGIFRCLARQTGIGAELEDELFDALQRKSAPDIDKLLDGSGLDQKSRRMMQVLAELSGGVEILDEARKALRGAGKPLLEALANLEAVVGAVKERHPDVPLYVDLTELRGYRYHTGVVFSAFVPGQGSALARGGRYDGAGAAFGAARAATGFSTDLMEIAGLAGAEAQHPGRCIAASPGGNPALLAEIAALRESGERVIVCLPEERGRLPRGCDRALVERGGKWVIEPVTGK